MGHLIFGQMQRLNIEAARRQAGQDLLQTPNPILPPNSAGGTGTPISLSTPDILNSLIAITNPFFESSSLPDESDTLSQQDFEEPQEKKVFANLDIPATVSSNSSAIFSGNQLSLPSLISTTTTSSTTSQCIGSPLSIASNSTFSDGTRSPPPPQLSLQPAKPSSSVESMRSKLIKDSLKLTIQTKRKNSGKEELDVKSELVAKRPKREEVLELTYDFSNDSIAESLPPSKLTPEDEERRKRRRERNKVAATKCRNKKKEKTVLLVKEAEVLETDNVTLKSEIAQMEEEFKRLTALLAAHAPNCPLTLHEQKPSLNSSSHHQTQNNNNQQQQQQIVLPSMSNLNTPYTTSSSGGSVYNNNQEVNSHLAISSHHNHFMGSNSSNMMNNMNYFNNMHHQTIQLS